MRMHLKFPSKQAFTPLHVSKKARAIKRSLEAAMIYSTNHLKLKSSH